MKHKIVSIEFPTIDWPDDFESEQRRDDWYSFRNHVEGVELQKPDSLLDDAERNEIPTLKDRLRRRIMRYLGAVNRQEARYLAADWTRAVILSSIRIRRPMPLAFPQTVHLELVNPWSNARLVGFSTGLNCVGPYTCFVDSFRVNGGIPLLPSPIDVSVLSRDSMLAHGANYLRDRPLLDIGQTLQLSLRFSSMPKGPLRFYVDLDLDDADGPGRGESGLERDHLDVAWDKISEEAEKNEPPAQAAFRTQRDAVYSALGHNLDDDLSSVLSTIRSLRPGQPGQPDPYGR